jgi:hypothetical protein
MTWRGPFAQTTPALQVAICASPLDAHGPPVAEILRVRRQTRKAVPDKPMPLCDTLLKTQSTCLIAAAETNVELEKAHFQKRARLREIQQ